MFIQKKIKKNSEERNTHAKDVVILFHSQDGRVWLIDGGGHLLVPRMAMICSRKKKKYDAKSIYFA